MKLVFGSGVYIIKSVWDVIGFLERFVSIDLIDGEVEILEILGNIVVKKKKKNFFTFKYKMLKEMEWFLIGNFFLLLGSYILRCEDVDEYVSYW